MKLALCIGNNYPGTPYALSGCVNDATDWAQLLARKGYDVTLALEVGAASILEEFGRMVARAGYGDRIVLSYSGHGTWVPDRGGDESDGRDEALVGADMHLVTDDELQLVGESLHRSAGGLLLLDSCHSGTAARMMGPFDAPGPARGEARFIPPTQLFPRLSEARALALEERPPSTSRKTLNLVSGARDDQYAWDAWFGDRPNGAFTRAAIDTYDDGVSLARWHKRIRTRLPSEEYDQEPQLTTSSLYRRYAAAL